MSQIRSITLLGSSSGRNAGDAALISGIMDSIDAACGRRIRYEIPTVKPQFIRNSYKNDAHAVSMLPWSLSLKMLGLPTYRSIMSTDLTLIFDAILFDRSLYNPLFNYLSTLSLLLPLAKKRGKKLGCYNVGAGPVDSPHGQRILKSIAEMMDFITVRDEQSLQLLRNLGVQNPRILLTADAALNLQATDETRAREILLTNGIDPSRPFLAININAYLDTWARPKRPSMGKERFLAVYSAALRRFHDEVKAPIVLFSTQYHDVEISKELIARTGLPIPLIGNYQWSHYDVTGAMRFAGLLYGMRLHSVILASSVLTPVAGIAYQPKVEHYLKLLGLGEHVLFFDQYNEEGLYRSIRSAWEAREQIRQQLQRQVPKLQQRANIAASIVSALDPEKDSTKDIAKFFSEAAPSAGLADERRVV